MAKFLTLALLIFGTSLGANAQNRIAFDCKTTENRRFQQICGVAHSQSAARTAVEMARLLGHDLSQAYQNYAEVVSAQHPVYIVETASNERASKIIFKVIVTNDIFKNGSKIEVLN